MSHKNQNHKSFGRGKHSNHPNTVVHTSIQFDKLLCENGNRPTAAKSAGTVGKWGITSFTSIRSSTFGPKEGSRFSSVGKKRLPSSPEVVGYTKRAALNNKQHKESSPVLNQPRKFFKSRNSDSGTSDKKYGSYSSAAHMKKALKSFKLDEESDKKPKHYSHNEKVLNSFPHKKEQNPLVQVYDNPLKLSISTKNLFPPVMHLGSDKEEENHNVVPDSPSKERDKPPIVLRIFKGTSQLITEPTSKSASPENEQTEPEFKIPSPQQKVKARDVENDNVVSRMEVDIPNNLDAKDSHHDSKSPPSSVITRNLRRRPAAEPIQEPYTSPKRILRNNSKPAPAAERERAAAPEPVQEPPPQTSPRRVLRTTRSTTASVAAATVPISAAPATPAAPAASKIVISNLHSDNPTVKTLPSKKSSSMLPATRKEWKESKTHKHSHHRNKVKNNCNTKLENAAVDVETNKEEREMDNYDRLKKAEELLADSCMDTDSVRNKIQKPTLPVKKNSSVDTKQLEAARAELLKVLEGDDSVKNKIQKPTLSVKKNSNSVDTKQLEAARAELLKVLEGDEDDIEEPPDISEDKENENTVKEVPKLKLSLKTKNSYVCKSVTPIAVEEKVITDPVESSTQPTSPQTDLPQPNLITESNREPEGSNKISAEDTATNVNNNTTDIIATSDGSCSSKTDDKAIDATRRDSEIDSVKQIISSEPTDKELRNDAVEGVGNLSTSYDAEIKTDTTAKDDLAKEDIQIVKEDAVSQYIPTKKGSIFKSRGAADGNKKRLALYKHKWLDEKDHLSSADIKDEETERQTKNTLAESVYDDDFDALPLTKVTKPVSDLKYEDPKVVTSFRCAKKNKEYYTVVKNVKNAHQIQESGEFQEFNDDVEYILDALQDNNPIGTRCLSTITLATKCMEPAFRMHVRAHGTVTKFFKALHDATKDQSLGMCTATVMFVLSQDRLNMDLDHNSLELMLNLLESDASHKNALDDCGLTDLQLTKTRDRVRQICADIQAQGHAKHLNLDNITIGQLAMETLLSLTSKRAGEWFKEELRDLGGLEHIIKTIVECCRHVDETANAWSSTSLEKIRKVNRCPVF